MVTVTRRGITKNGFSPRANRLVLVHECKSYVYGCEEEALFSLHVPATVRERVRAVSRFVVFG